MTRMPSQRDKQKLPQRMIRWFTYTIGFALLPLCISILIRGLAGKLSIEALTNSPDILFFSLIISASALGDINETTNMIGWDIIFSILFSALMLGAIISAILYGSFLSVGIFEIKIEKFYDNLLWVSILLGFCLFILGTIVEFLIGKIEANR